MCQHLLGSAHQLMRIKKSTLLWGPCLKPSASSKGLVRELIFLALAGSDHHGMEKQPGAGHPELATKLLLSQEGKLGSNC